MVTYPASPAILARNHYHKIAIGMSEHASKYAKYALCSLEDIPEGSCKGFSAKADAFYADIFVVRTQTGVYAYRNRCPHTGAPMEAFPDEFLDYQMSYILCAVHGARFQIENGYCIFGPCLHHSLARIQVKVEDGMIFTFDEISRQPT